MQHSLNTFPPKSIDIVPTTTETTRGYQIEWYKIVSQSVTTTATATATHMPQPQRIEIRSIYS